MNLNTTIMAAAKSLSNAFRSYWVGTSVLKLESTLDIVMEFIEEVIE